MFHESVSSSLTSPPGQARISAFARISLGTPLENLQRRPHYPRIEDAAVKELAPGHLGGKRGLGTLLLH